MSVQYERPPLIHQRYTILSQCSNDGVNLEVPKPATTESTEGTKAKLPTLQVNKSDTGRLEYSEPVKEKNKDYADFIRTLSRGRTSSNSSGSSRLSPKANMELIVDPKSTNGLADVMRLKQKNEEKHEITMKVIEDHMWQHKQEERELKRAEGDILKRQLQLKRTMASYSADMERRKKRKERDAHEKVLEMESRKQNFAVTDKKNTNQRVYRNMGFENKVKDKGRKSMLLINGLEFQYKKTAEALRLKRIEIDNLTKQYEQRLKQKEEEEYQLKKKLADLSISLNMEAQKHRKQVTDFDKDKLDLENHDVQERNQRESDLDDKLRHSSDLASQNERNKQILDKELNKTLEDLTLQLREEDRRLTDVRNRISTNALNQRNLQQAANYSVMDRYNDESDERVRFATAKKNERLKTFTNLKKVQNFETMKTWQQNNLTKTNEAEMKNKEDDIQHLKRSVRKQEDNELSLLQQAKSSESRRMKIEQTLSCLEDEYEITRQRNAKMLKEAATKCHQEERDIKDKITKEQSALAKAFNEREDSIQNLVKLRANLSADKDMLGEEIKVYDRLQRVGLKTADARRELVS